MAGGVFTDFDFPTFPPTEFIVTTSDQVIFRNFVVDHAEPRPEHLAFIRSNLIPFFIRQVDALGFPNDNNLDLFLIGFASATGQSTHNLGLSSSRAAAIGSAIAQEFQRQKAQSKFAKGITVTPHPKGAGDGPARANLEALKLRNPELRRHPLSSRDIELLQPTMRSVLTTLKLHHEVEDDDTKVDCRQLLTAKIKVEKVPANHLEQVLDDIEHKIPPALKFVLDQGIEFVKNRIVKELKSIITELAVDFPEIAIVFATIDFIIPSDIKNQFEFRNHRGNSARYNYTGSQNKIGVDVFEALAKLLSVFKWLTKVDEALEKFDKLKPNVEALEKVLKNVKTAVKTLEKLETDLENRDGLIRKHLGDGVADVLIALLKAGKDNLMVVPATEFFPVAFVSKGVFDVNTFSGFARTEVVASLGRTKTTLEFLGAGPEGRLGFGAATIIFGPFAITNSLIGFGISKGNLIRA
jgi:hypothetical protein